MKKTIILFLFFCCLVNISFGQDKKIKFGKIDPSDLSMKVYESDTEATAVMLSKIGSISYDLHQEKYVFSEEEHVVIKILKEAGIDEFGNAVIPYYADEDFSRLSYIKAMVHLPDGTELKVENNQIFDEKTNAYWSRKKIAFPKLVPGAIVEYQYKIVSSGIFHPVDWFFQQDIPIVYAELTTRIPKWYDYVVLTQGTPLDNSLSQSTSEEINTTTMQHSAYGMSNGSHSSMNESSFKVEFNLKTYIKKDVPAMKEECCITTMKDYYTRVRYQLKAVEFPNSPIQPVMNSWKKLADDLYALTEWGGQFHNKRPGELVREAAGLYTDPGATTLQIAQKIYDYINHNIQWNYYYDYTSDAAIGDILKSKSACSGDLNKLMCAALQQSGIEAKPVLLSTRDHGKPVELYPFTYQFDHMVVLAKIDGKDVWIDAGDPNRPIGTLREEALNGRAWVVDETEPYWTDIKPTTSKSVYLIKGTIDKEGNLNGDVETRFTGYHALHQRSNAVNEKEKFGDNFIVCANLPVKISGLEKINTAETSMPFQVKGKIVNQPLATTTPDKLFINPIFPTGFDEMPFKLEKRDYPIEMNYPEELSIILNLELPEGYAIESVPAPIKYTLENGGVQVIYEATQTPGKLNITMKYVITSLEFQPAEYEVLKTIYNHRQQKFNEQIVLTKV